MYGFFADYLDRPGDRRGRSHRSYLLQGDKRAFSHRGRPYGGRHLPRLSFWQVGWPESADLGGNSAGAHRGLSRATQGGEAPRCNGRTAAPASLQSLPTWLELEQRFNDLHPALQFSRIDIVTGASGEHFTIAGAADRESIDRFKAVAGIAGARLQRDFPDEIGRHQQLARESDPLMLWYKALRHIGGSGAATVFIGTIDQPAAASANLCRTMATRRRNLQP